MLEIELVCTVGYTGDKKREYDREWVRKRRATFFAGKCCVKCGSTESLELDHIDPAEKVSHAIWSWREERRLAEAAKCQVLCYKCHKKKTLTVDLVGDKHPSSKYSNEQVAYVKQLHEEGLSLREISKKSKVNYWSVWSIVNGRTRLIS